MKKIITILIVTIALIIGGFFWLNNYIYQEKQGGAGPVADYKNAAYEIDGQQIKLGDTTKYFGNEVQGDFNNDGTEDIAFLITQDTGGSGLFYYTTVALKQLNGYVGTNAVFLGDRIAPQSTEVRAGKIIVNYADRAVGEPMVTTPSVGVTVYLRIVDGRLATTTVN